MARDAARLLIGGRECIRLRLREAGGGGQVVRGAAAVERGAPNSLRRRRPVIDDAERWVGRDVERIGMRQMDLGRSIRVEDADLEREGRAGFVGEVAREVL